MTGTPQGGELKAVGSFASGRSASLTWHRVGA
jgi:hypothetical protein